MVERARLKALLEEQKLGQSGKVDPASAARVGKLLGARFLCWQLFRPQERAAHRRARRRGGDGADLRSVGTNGAADDFWALEKSLAQKLGEVLEGVLPAFTRPAATAPAKVKSRTIVTYGRALTAIDCGRKDEARKSCSIRW